MRGPSPDATTRPAPILRPRYLAFPWRSSRARDLHGRALLSRPAPLRRETTSASSDPMPRVGRRTWGRRGPAVTGPVAVLLLGLCGASVAHSEPLRLDQALDLARACPSLRAASADVDVARAHLVQAGL